MINKILVRVNRRKIKQISYTGVFDEKLESLFWNIWAQFDIYPSTQLSNQTKITDFAWTEKARKEFYRDPNHSYILRRLKFKNMEKRWIQKAEPLLIKVQSY